MFCFLFQNSNWEKGRVSGQVGKPSPYSSKELGLDSAGSRGSERFETRGKQAQTCSSEKAQRGGEIGEEGD